MKLKNKEYQMIIIYLPFWQVNANCMVFPPTPQKASTIILHRQRFAI